MSKRATKAKRPVRRSDPHAGTEPARERCEATTAKGARCKRLALQGETYCAVHLGAPVGRTPKLTPEVTEQVVAALRVGAYMESAAARAGISKQSLYNWLERGDPEGTRRMDQPYRDFREAVERARGEGENHLTLRVVAGAQKDWRAAAWMLERQYPDRWGGTLARRDAGGAIGGDDPGGVNPLDGPPIVDDQVDTDGRAL